MINEAQYLTIRQVVKNYDHPHPLPPSIELTNQERSTSLVKQNKTVEFKIKATTNIYPQLQKSRWLRPIIIHSVELRVDQYLDFEKMYVEEYRARQRGSWLSKSARSLSVTALPKNVTPNILEGGSTQFFCTVWTLHLVMHSAHTPLGPK